MKKLVDLDGGLIAVINYNVKNRLEYAELKKLVEEKGDEAEVLQHYGVSSIQLLRGEYSKLAEVLSIHQLDKINEARAAIEGEPDVLSAKHELDNWEW